MTHRILLILILVCLAGCRSSSPTLRQSPSSSHMVTNLATVDQSIGFANAQMESASIAEYVQMGLARNPRIATAQHRANAIGHRIAQSLSLPDPMVNTNTHLSPVQTAAGEQAFSLGVSQKLTNPERRATRASIVADEVAAAESELEQIQLEVATSIRNACYQLLFIRKSVELTLEDQESLDRIGEMILEQYEVKKSVTQQDVLNIQSERSKVENQLTELKQKERSAELRLARLVHVDAHSEFEIRDKLAIGDTELDAESLIQQALQFRPDLKSQIANIRRDRKKVRLARLEERPDFTVGLNWIATSSSGISPVANGEDALLLGIGFNLPVYKSRIRAGICEAKSNQLASESQLKSLQDEVAEEVFDLVARLESTSEMLSLMQEDIIPKAIRTLDLSIDEYSTDSTDYVQLISNWRSLLRYRISEANLQSQYQLLMAEMAQSVGQLDPLSSGPNPSISELDFENE